MEDEKKDLTQEETKETKKAKETGHNHTITLNGEPVSKEEALGKQEEKKYTDKEVDEIVKRKLAKWEKEKDKAVSEAEKLAKMNEEEKNAYETQKLKDRLAELEKKETLHEMTKTARSILADKGIQVEENLLSRLITEDAETTKENVESFAGLFTEAVDKAVTEKLKGKTPKRMESKVKSGWDLVNAKYTRKER